MTRLPFLIEDLMAIGFVVLFISQVIVPIWRGTPCFPMFSRPRRKLERDITEAQEEADLSILKKRLKSLKRKSNG